MNAPIKIERAGRLGRVRLARPETTNSMSMEGFDAILAALESFAGEAEVEAVVIDHIGDRGFCVGGDAVGLAKSGRGDGRWAHDYFAQQARLNSRIHHFPKPVITVADGATIGGGVGLLLPAAVRVATERTMVAFMETAVGMVPDVGASWVLPRLPGATGVWLALTGARVVGEDAVRRGLADIYIESDKVTELVDRLTVDSTALPSPAAPSPPDPQVEAVFAEPSVEAIIAALEAADDPWSAKQLAAIRRASPTATIEAFDLVHRGASFGAFDEALAAESKVNGKLVRGHDWLSFTRANLLEKDLPATHDPKTIEAVLADRARRPAAV
jgi:enoyl-CoA hydratase